MDIRVPIFFTGMDVFNLRETLVFAGVLFAAWISVSAAEALILNRKGKKYVPRDSDSNG